MAEKNPNLLGQIAIREGFIKPKQLEDCLLQQHRAGKPMSLGELLVWERYITRDQLDDLLHIQATHFARVPLDVHPGGLLGQLSVELGYVTKDQLNDALREQQESGKKQGLGLFLLRKGYITAEQLLTLLRRQNRLIVKCPGCPLFYDLTDVKEGRSIKCFECQSEVKAPATTT